MTLSSFMSAALDFIINLALIIGVLAIIYIIIWVAIFFPIIKLRKHKQKVFEMEKKYNKIEVEYGTKMKLKEETNEKLRQTLYILAQKESQLEDIEKKLSDATKKITPDNDKKNKK